MEQFTAVLFGGGLGLFVFVLMLFVLLFTVGVLVLWIWMIVDCARREFDDPSGNLRLVWILVIVLAGWVGALIYLLVVKIPGNKK